MYSPDLARDPRIAQMPGMVERLAESDDIEVLVALAENPALPEFPPGALALLMSSPAMEVVLRRDDLPWEHPQLAPYAILRGNADDHRRAAQRPDLHEYPEAAWRLAGHPDDSVREALAANPAIGQIDGFVRQLVRRSFGASVQRGLARNPALVQYPDVARKLAASGRTRRWLAENPALPALPEDVVQPLLQDKDVFLELLARRNDLPWDQPPFAPYAILRGDYFDHRRAARRPDLHQYPQAAWHLARHPDDNVRETLAINPVIVQVEGLVEAIAQREADKQALRGLASNPAFLSFPPAVIERLVRDEYAFAMVIARRDDLPWDQPPFAPYAILRGNFYDHLQVAQRPDLYKYPQAAWHLAKHSNNEIREALAANPAIGQIENLIETIAGRKSDPSAWHGLARNPALARYPDVARKLAASSEKTRRYLAENPALPALPEDVVQSLLQDRDIFLYRLARRNDLPWDQPSFAPYAILRGDFAVHGQAARRPDLYKYPEAAWYLARHPDDSVREALAANPAIGQIESFFSYLHQLIFDESIARGLARNPALAQHPYTAELIAKSAEGRLWLAENPALPAFPKDVVQSLLQDKDIFQDVLAKRDDLPWDRPPFAPYAAMRPRPAQPTQPAAQQQGSDGWIEIKAIHGRRYRYLRWREGGKKRSRYLGKDTDA